jgi:hypothetical protein
MAGVTIILCNSGRRYDETDHEYCKEGGHHGSNIAKICYLSR